MGQAPRQVQWRGAFQGGHKVRLRVHSAGVAADTCAAWPAGFEQRPLHSFSTQGEQAVLSKVSMSEEVAWGRGAVAAARAPVCVVIRWTQAGVAPCCRRCDMSPGASP